MMDHTPPRAFDRDGWTVNDIAGGMQLASHALSFGAHRLDVIAELRSRGLSQEDAFLALSAAVVLHRDTPTVPDTGNRRESCVQVVKTSL